MSYRGHILIGVSGGIAVYKIPDLIRELIRRDYQVGAVLTPSAQRFVTADLFRSLCNGPVLADIWESEGGRIRHIEVADWADLYLIAPATATTLARLANGLAEEPVSLVYLATRAQKVIVPAMNVNMWKSAPVQRNIQTLVADGTILYPPESGLLACGWIGEGRLPRIEKLVEFVEDLLFPQTLRGIRLVITAGATREHLDPIRYLSNPATGQMGFALARIACRMGAKVWLVTGPTNLPTPPGVERRDVMSAEEMLSEVRKIFLEEKADGIIASAAVADFKPDSFTPRKIKKNEGDSLILRLVPTPDILKTIVEEFHPSIRIGFAAETDDLEEYAKRKLKEKDLQLIIANRISRENPAFGDRENAVTLFFADGRKEELPPLPKEEIARRILKEIPSLREKDLHPAPGILA